MPMPFVALHGAEGPLFYSINHIAFIMCLLLETLYYTEQL